MALPRFGASADVYFGFYAPDIDPLELYQLAADNALVPFSSGVVP